VTLIVEHRPAPASFPRLAIYFVAQSPAATVERMAQTFMHTDGDIAAVLDTLFLAREFNAALGSKFKTRCASWCPPCASPMTAVRSPTPDRCSTG